MKYSFGVGEDIHGLWNNLVGLQEPMEGQVPTISELATDETNIDPKQLITWESEQKLPDIHSLWKPQCKNMLLDGIKLYLKLEVWFVADCTVSPNASVINVSEYNLLCGLYNNFLFKWLMQKIKPKQK